MKDLPDKEFKNLSSFCDDNFEDPWDEHKVLDSVTKLSDRYTHKELIATGGMKEIYKVFDTKMHRFIAMAQLIPDTDEELSEAFLKEATLTSALEHPNIISVYDLGINEDHEPFFTMELKVGKSLDEIIDNEEATPNELLEIFLKVCDAIAYAHSTGVIHLDLKPDNIQVGQFGEVQVCDWGLSQKVDGAVPNTQVNGTPGYMAPEQSLKGEIMDYSTDIFALGALLYSILTSDRPIEGGVDTILNITVNEKILSPLERFPEKNIPKSLDAVVKKAMAQKKVNRYRSVDALKNEVHQFLDGRSTIAENAGFFKEFSLFFNRNRQVCLVTVAAFLTIFTASFIFIIQVRSSQLKTEQALVQLQESQKLERHAFAEKESALKKYIAAEESRKKYQAELQNRELQLAKDFMSYPLFFSAPENNCEKALKIFKARLRNDPENKELKNLIVQNLFISQKFTELERYKGSDYQSLLTIATKFSTAGRTSLGIVDENTLLKILIEINRLPAKEMHLKTDISERLICYMVDVRKPVFTSIDILKELLKCWNPKWNADLLIYDRDNLNMQIKGEEIKKLMGKTEYASHLCFLRFVKIESLDLRDSGIISLEHIEGLSINRIDIRNTKINNLHPHNATKNIKEVILFKGQFDEESLVNIPESVELIIK